MTSMANQPQKKTSKRKSKPVTVSGVIPTNFSVNTTTSLPLTGSNACTCLKCDDLTTEMENIHGTGKYVNPFSWIGTAQALTTDSPPEGIYGVFYLVETDYAGTFSNYLGTNQSHRAALPNVSNKPIKVTKIGMLGARPRHPAIENGGHEYNFYVGSWRVPREKLITISRSIERPQATRSRWAVYEVISRPTNGTAVTFSNVGSFTFLYEEVESRKFL